MIDNTEEYVSSDESENLSNFLGKKIINADLFSSPICFYIDEDPKYGSKCGGFLSIIIILITIAYASYFCFYFVGGKSPNILTSKEINNHPKEIKYPEDFFFMFQIKANQEKINTSFFTPYGFISNGKNSSEDKPISIEKCDKIKGIKDKYYDFVKGSYNLSLEEFYCMNKTNDTVLNEFWGNENFSMLQIKIYKCNSTNSGECHSNEKELNETLSKPIVSVYSLNNNFEGNNKFNPFVKSLREDFFFVL